jgi:NAD(P)-dependent dehydrogenase (short-subunit alcohol dehydrogenase family)
MGRLDNKVCLITGGASGIGAAAVRLFAKEGATVAFTDIQDEPGAALAEETGAQYAHHDVADESAWISIIDDVKARHGRLDVTVNNAGIFRPGTIEELTVNGLREVLDVNLIGVAVGCRESIRVMKDNPGGPKGSIVNVSSITGFFGLASGAAYTASKGAVRLLTKSVAVHCARTYRGIRCNSVHPGVIDTPMNQAAFDASEDANAMREFFAGIQPIGRMTTPEEIAGGILYLASDEASSTNGTELLIDGGWLAAPNPL